MQHPDSGVLLTVEAGEGLGRALHGMIEAASVIAANVEILIGRHPRGDEALVDDTRTSVERLVSLAREAQRFRRAEPSQRARATG